MGIDKMNEYLWSYILETNWSKWYSHLAQISDHIRSYEDVELNSSILIMVLHIPNLDKFLKLIPIVCW